MIKEILVAAIILLSIPTGYLIAWLCRDELIVGRKWFRTLIIIALISGIIFLIYGNYIIVFTLLFMLIVTLISLIKSFDRKWTSRKI
jgi:hypothetical protein